MVVIVVDSMTGLGKRFAEKLGYPVFDIQAYQADEHHDIFLITRSVNFGQIPDTTQAFLDQFAKKVIGLAVSGNRNWGKNFGAAGDKISLAYGIPLVLKFELGFPHEVNQVKTWLSQRRQPS